MLRGLRGICMRMSWAEHKATMHSYLCTHTLALLSGCISYGYLPQEPMKSPHLSTHAIDCVLVWDDTVFLYI
jgi:hypothetical protein